MNDRHSKLSILSGPIPIFFCIGILSGVLAIYGYIGLVLAPTFFLLSIIYLVIRRLFKPILFLFAGTSLPFILLAIYVVTFPFIEDFFSKKDFSSKDWKEAGQNENIRNPVRIHMVENLLKMRHLVGMNKAEIDSLLGPPIKTEYFKEYDYVYWLGPERDYDKVDSEWLVFKFTNNIVSECRLIHD